MSALGGRAWAVRRAEILARDGGICQIRGPRCTGIATTVDHVVPRRVGGGHEPSNLRAACYPCNVGRENRRRRRPAPGWLPSSSLGGAP